MKRCKHSNCAICTNSKYRDIFSFVLKNKYPDIYFCDNCIYKITTPFGYCFKTENLEDIKRDSKGYYWMDIYKNMKVYLSKGNFTIICKNEGECNKTPETFRFK